MKAPESEQPSLCTSINRGWGGLNIWASKGYLRRKRKAQVRGVRREVSADACPQSHRVLCHTRAIMKASRPWLMGPMLTGSASDRSFSCPRVLLGSAPTLLCQWKIRKIQACPADMNRFSVIPGILLGGGSIHSPGHHSGAPRALVSTRQLHAESSVCLARLHARTPRRRQVSHATRGRVPRNCLPWVDRR